MTNIKKYASKLANKYDYDSKTRIDLQAQFIDHISSLKSEYLEKGMSEKEATLSAINDFSKDGNLIHEKYKQNYHINLFVKYIMTTFFILSVLLISVTFLSPTTNEAQTVNAVRHFTAPHAYLATVNLTPFRSISKMIFGKPSNYAPLPLFFYIIIFIPLGLFIPFAINKYINYIHTVKACIICVILGQVIRAIFPVGFVNIDIALLNFLGCLIGLAFYRYVLLNLYLKTKFIVSLRVF